MFNVSIEDQLEEVISLGKIDVTYVEFNSREEIESLLQDPVRCKEMGLSVFYLRSYLKRIGVLEGW